MSGKNVNGTRRASRRSSAKGPYALIPGEDDDGNLCMGDEQQSRSLIGGVDDILGRGGGASRSRSLNTYRNWWAFWILGTINNLAFVVVMSAASSLACKFNALNEIAAISWANVAVGVFVRLANTIFLLSVSESKRIAGATLCFLVGLGGVAASVLMNPNQKVFILSLGSYTLDVALGAAVLRRIRLSRLSGASTLK